MKRILLSLVLILALLMPGWSCAEAPAGYEAYDEPITITVGKKVNANPSFADAADTQENNEMTRIIKDVLNIDVKLAWESDEYDTKLAMSIISQDLPDVFVVNDRLVYQQLVENNLLPFRDYSRRQSPVLSNSTVEITASPASIFCFAIMELKPPMVSCSNPAIEPLRSRMKTNSVRFFLILYPPYFVLL